MLANKAVESIKERVRGLAAEFDKLIGEAEAGEAFVRASEIDDVYAGDQARRALKSLLQPYNQAYSAILPIVHENMPLRERELATPHHSCLSVISGDSKFNFRDLAIHLRTIRELIASIPSYLDSRRASLDWSIRHELTTDLLSEAELLVDAGTFAQLEA